MPLANYDCLLGFPFAHERKEKCRNLSACVLEMHLHFGELVARRKERESHRPQEMDRLPLAGVFPERGQTGKFEALCLWLAEMAMGGIRYRLPGGKVMPRAALVERRMVREWYRPTEANRLHLVQAFPERA